MLSGGDVCPGDPAELRVSIAIILGAVGATFRRVVSALRAAAAAAIVHRIFLGVKHGAVRIVSGELRVENRDDFMEK